MRKTFKDGMYILIVFFSLFIGSQATYANEEKKPNPSDSAGFYYELIYPENQKETQGYFDLKMTPGQKQVTQIVVKNLGDQEITIESSLNGAKTNSSGVIEYGPNNLENDPSLKFDFSELVKAPEKIILAPNEEKMLDIEIAMPETSFDGIIVGGIQLKKVDDEHKKTTGNGATIVNKYAYVIAMVLSETETKVTPELSLNKVEVNQYNYRNAVFANISNTSADFVKKLSIEVQVTPKGKDEVWYETKKAGMTMAPNTFIYFPVSMNGEKMIPGEYVANILAKSGAQQWKWNETFTITNEQADKFNTDDVDLIRKKGINWTLAISVAVGIFTIVVLIFVGIKMLRRRKPKNRRRKK